MKGQESACETHGGSKPQGGASAWEERSRIQTDHNLKGNYLKEARQKSRGVISTSCPHEGHVQSMGTRGLWSEGQEKGPKKAHQSRGMCWLEGVQGGTWIRHSRGRAVTPNLPAAGVEGSCPHPSLWAPYPRPRTLPATRSSHIPQSTRFAVWSLLNFKKQRWLWDQVSLRRGGHHTSMARILGWSVLCHPVSRRDVRSHEDAESQISPNTCKGRQRHRGKQSGTL